MDIKYSDIDGGWEGDGNINVDPLFIDINADFYLLPNSPCINVGTDSSVYFDFDKEPRPDPESGLFDIGADEFYSTTATTITQTPTVTATSTPSDTPTFYPLITPTLTPTDTPTIMPTSTFTSFPPPTTIYPSMQIKVLLQGYYSPSTQIQCATDVTIEFRTGSSPSNACTIIDSINLSLDINGDSGLIVLPNIPSGECYLVCKQLNHLPVITDQKIMFQTRLTT